MSCAKWREIWISSNLVFIYSVIRFWSNGPASLVRLFWTNKFYNASSLSRNWVLEEKKKKSFRRKKKKVLDVIRLNYAKYIVFRIFLTTSNFEIGRSYGNDNLIWLLKRSDLKLIFFFSTVSVIVLGPSLKIPKLLFHFAYLTKWHKVTFIGISGLFRIFTVK